MVDNVLTAPKRCRPPEQLIGSPMACQTGLVGDADLDCSLASGKEFGHTSTNQQERRRAEGTGEGGTLLEGLVSSTRSLRTAHLVGGMASLPPLSHQSTGHTSKMKQSESCEGSAANDYISEEGLGTMAVRTTTQIRSSLA